MFVKKGMAGFVGMITKIVAIVVATNMIASVAIPAVFNANTTGWDAGTTSTFKLAGIALAAYLILLIFSA